MTDTDRSAYVRGPARDGERRPSPPDKGDDTSATARFPCRACGKLDCENVACGLDRCRHCKVTADEAIVHGHAPDCPNRVAEPFPMAADVVRLGDVQRERVKWLWPNRLPFGKLAVLDGDPGTGKSTVAVDLAARVTTASPMPDGAEIESTGNVVMLTAEDGLADTVRPRVEAAGGDPQRVYMLSGIRDADGTERPPRIPDDLATLVALVEGVGADLVVIDVLAAYLSGAVDSYRDADVRRALHPLARLAEDTGAVVLVLRHLSKSGGTNAIYRGGGSIGIIGAARVGLLAATDPDDEGRRILAVTKSNLAAIPPALAYRLTPADEYGCARTEWLGATEHSAGDLLVVRGDEERSERDEAVDFLVDLLESEGGAMPAKEVKRAARAAGIAERTLDRARQRAGVTTGKVGFGAGGPWVWSLHSRHDDPLSRHSRHHSERGVYGEKKLHGGENGRADPQRFIAPERLLTDQLADDGAVDLGAWTSDAPERAREAAAEAAYPDEASA